MLKTQHMMSFKHNKPQYLTNF